MWRNRGRAERKRKWERNEEKNDLHIFILLFRVILFFPLSSIFSLYSFVLFLFFSLSFLHIFILLIRVVLILFSLFPTYFYFILFFCLIYLFIHFYYYSNWDKIRNSSITSLNITASVFQLHFIWLSSRLRFILKLIKRKRKILWKIQTPISLFAVRYNDIHYD